MKTKTYSQAEISHLIQQFEAGTLPKVQWTHEAHLLVGISYAYHYPKAEAMEKLRLHIRAYNVAVGTPNSDTEGYHESITHFWLWVAMTFLKNQDFPDLESAARAFLQSEYSRRTYPLLYYSRAHLFSTEARKTYQKPDRRPLGDHLLKEVNSLS
ncbi:MAG: hypothetical protein AAFU64_18830 [Bacteroidota bacterium]